MAIEGPVLEAARALTPVLRQHRAFGEEHARMAPEAHAAIHDAGLFTMTAPRELGAFEVSFPEEIAALEEIAFADPSAGWVIGNSNAISAVTVRIDETAGRQLLADPHASFGFGLAATGELREVDGGYELRGRWPVVSGAHGAAWFLMASRIFDGDEPRLVNELPVVRFAAVPAEAVAIEDTWSDVVAVRGSGSHAVSVAPTFVPGGLIADVQTAPRIDRPRFQVPMMVGQSMMLGAIATGIARSAVDAAVSQARERVSIVSGTGWREWPAVQDSIAASEVAVLSARAGLLEVASDLWATLDAGEELAPEQKARAHAMGDHAMRMGRETVSRVFTTGSVDALHEGHGLEIALRNVHGFSVQWERYRRFQYQAGRVLMGAEPNDPTF